MDLNVRIIHHEDFLTMTPSGEIDLDRSKQLLLSLVSVNKPPNNYDVLLDFRDTTPRLTVVGITKLVEVMIDNRASFRYKLAILTLAGSGLELAKFMEVYAQNRGFQVAAFDNFEAAILWLSTITDVAPKKG